MRRAILCWCVGLLATSPALVLGAQAAAEEAAVRKALEQFFAAYSRKDLAAVTAFWSAGSPQRDAFTQFARADFAAADLQVVQVRCTRTQIRGNQGSVRAWVDGKRIDARTKRPLGTGLVWNVQLIQEGGTWKWRQWSEAFGELAGALVRAGTRAERDTLLRRELELVRPALVDAVRLLGNQQAERRQFDAALRCNDVAFEVAERVGDAAATGRCFLARGYLHHLQARLPEARQHYEKAVTLFRAAGDREWEGKTQNNLANLLERAGRYAEALTAYEASLKVARELGDAAWEGKTLDNLGSVYEQLGRYAEALETLQAALRSARLLRAPVQEARARNNLGIVYQATGRYAEALAELEASLRLKRDLGLKAEEASTLVNVGNVYRATGRFVEAVRAYDTALEYSRALKGPAVEAQALNNLGTVHALAGRHGEARAAFQAALAASRALADRSLEATALANLGSVHEAEGQPGLARVAYEACLEIQRALGRRAEEARLLNNLGTVYRLQGEHAAARTAYEAALRIAEPLGDVENVTRCWYNLGWVHRAEKRWELVVEANRRAVAGMEQLRAGARETSLQLSIFHQSTAPYHALAEALVELGRPAEAFAISEQAKARTLIELLQSGKADVQKAMSDLERRQERRLEGALTALTVQLRQAPLRTGADPEEIQTLRQQLDRTRADYDAFRRRLFLAHPELQVQRAAFVPASLRTLNRTLFAAQPDLVVLSYLASETHTLLFVLTRGRDPDGDAALAVHRVAVDLKELREEIGDFRRFCQSPGAAFTVDTERLYQCLLAPAAGALAGKGQLLVVPDGVLHTLPFHALRDPAGKYLLERHALSYAPSVTALLKMTELADRRRRDAPKAGSALLAVGRPILPPELKDLPASEQEVDRIAALFVPQATLLKGRAATVGAVKAELGQARHVHFATHGLVNEAAPLYSAIALSTSQDREDGLLYAHELLALSLTADTVVLSACRTALGQPLRGEGMLGLCWALFVAGAPASVVTQWAVADESTSILMGDFYRRLRRGQDSKAEALRQAQLALLKESRYQHPFYWAPFVLVGDAR